MLFSLLLLVVLLPLLVVLLDVGKLLSDVHMTSLYLLDHCLVHLWHLSQVNCAWSLMQKSESFDKRWPHILFMLLTSRIHIHTVKVLSIPFVVSWKIQFTFLNVKEVIHSTYLAGASRLPFDPRSTGGISVTSDILKPIFGNSLANIVLGMRTDWWLCHCLSGSSKHYYCNTVLRSVIALQTE